MCLTFTDTGASGSPALEAACLVDSTDPPIVEIDPTPEIVPEGGSCFIAWSSNKMARCEIRGEDSNAVLDASNNIVPDILAGGFETVALDETASFQITCWDEDDNEVGPEIATCVVNPELFDQ